MNDYLKIEYIPCPGHPGGYSVVITPAIVERANAMGLLPSVVKESLTTQPAETAWTCTQEGQEPKTWIDNHDAKPTAPADDEATVQALMVAIGGMCCDCAETRKDCERAVAAIRRREVPGLPSPDAFRFICAESKRLEAERDTLKAEVERMTHERNTALQELADCRRNLEKLDEQHKDDFEYIDRIKKQRDAAIARAEKLQQELNRAGH